MHSLYANLVNELHKWWLQPKTKWLLLVMMLIPILSAWLLDNGRTRTGIVLLTGSNLPMTMLSLLTTILLPLYLFMLAADSFSGELSARTLKNVLLRPIHKAKLFASKVLAVAVIIGLVLLLTGLVSAVSGLFMGGGGTASLGRIAGAYAAAFVPMMAVGVFAILISQWFTSSTLTIFVGVLLFGAVKFLPLFFPQAAGWSAFSYTDWGLQVSNGVSGDILFQGFALLLSYSMIGYMAAWLLFARKQL